MEFRHVFYLGNHSKQPSDQDNLPSSILFATRIASRDILPVGKISRALSYLPESYLLMDPPLLRPGLSSSSLCDES